MLLLYERLLLWYTLYECQLFNRSAFIFFLCFKSPCLSYEKMPSACLHETFPNGCDASIRCRPSLLPSRLQVPALHFVCAFGLCNGFKQFQEAGSTVWSAYVQCFGSDSGILTSACPASVEGAGSIAWPAIHQCFWFSQRNAHWWFSRGRRLYCLTCILFLLRGFATEFLPGLVLHQRW